MLLKKCSYTFSKFPQLCVCDVPHELQDHSDQICSIVTWVIFKGSIPHISVCSCSLSCLNMCTSLHTRLDRNPNAVFLFAGYVFEDDLFNISLLDCLLCVCVCVCVCVLVC